MTEEDALAEEARLDAALYQLSLSQSLSLPGPDLTAAGTALLHRYTLFNALMIVVGNWSRGSFIFQNSLHLKKPQTPTCINSLFSTDNLFISVQVGSETSRRTTTRSPCPPTPAPRAPPR